MCTSNEAAVTSEVEALQAIYGEELISYRGRQPGGAPASISIALESLLATQPHPAGRSVSLAALLPGEYPSAARPRAPTLRAERLAAATCARMVEQMLGRQQEGVEGEVCMYQWCDAMIGVLNEYAESAGDVGGGAVQPSAVGDCAAGEGAATGDDYVIFHGEALTDRKSAFQAHVAVVRCVEDVDGVVRQLKQGNRKIATAAHNTLAYRVDGGRRGVLQDADDDGEKGAGKCVLYVLQQLGALNVVCVVTRWFGGTLLGPVRFKHICKVARDLAEERLSEFQQSD